MLGIIIYEIKYQLEKITKQQNKILPPTLQHLPAKVSSSNTINFSYEVNQKGSLYQGLPTNNPKSSRNEVIVNTNEITTISYVSLQPSVQVLSNSSLGYGWPTSSHQSFLDHEKTLHMLDKYVCNDTFLRLKFISSPEMIAFSWDADSVCQMVCKDLKVDKIEQTRFWSIYSKCISPKLNKKKQRFQI